MSPRRALVLVLLCSFLSSVLTGCVSLPLDYKYRGPADRPASLDTYYSKGKSVVGHKEREVQLKKEFTLREIVINSEHGDITIDYYDTGKKNDDLILVFPLLGGKPIVSSHFAGYFAERGLDAAIVRRNEDFKNPANFGRIEEMLRLNVVRDRVAMDYFERNHGKKDFGGFGVSRGGINVALTAGVDPRLKYVVIAMGASDLPLIFRDSNEKRIKKYVEAVMKERQMTRPQVFSFLQENIKTDPKYTAKHIDARNTMMFLSVFDQTVPYEYGRRLRKEIGNPKTVFLAANHYTAAAFTQIISILPPGKDKGIFPFDYLELEALKFFRDKFEKPESTWRLWPFRVIRFPFDLIGYGVEKLF